MFDGPDCSLGDSFSFGHISTTCHPLGLPWTLRAYDGFEYHRFRRSAASLTNYGISLNNKQLPRTQSPFSVLHRFRTRDTWSLVRIRAQSASRRSYDLRSIYYRIGQKNRKLLRIQSPLSALHLVKILRSRDTWSLVWIRALPASPSIYDPRTTNCGIRRNSKQLPRTQSPLSALNIVTGYGS